MQIELSDEERQTVLGALVECSDARLRLLRLNPWSGHLGTREEVSRFRAIAHELASRMRLA